MASEREFSVFKFSIRDMFWLTALVAVALLLLLERWRHDGEIERAQAKTQEVEQERGSLSWQLVSAADVFEDIGYEFESDDKHVVVVGPFPQGNGGVEFVKVMAGDAWTGQVVKNQIGARQLPAWQSGRMIGGREMFKRRLPPVAAKTPVELR